MVKFQAFCLIFSSIMVMTRAKCPDPTILSQCTCLFDIVQCAQLPNQRITDQTLDEVFDKLSKNLPTEGKHFAGFYLTGTEVTQLKDRIFRDIVFDEISILDNQLLSKVHRDAFNGTDQVTTRIDIMQNPLLTQSDDNSLFEALSKMVNVEQINIAQGNNITEVPSYAFKPVNSYQDKLWMLSLGESIERINTRSFYHLTSLRVLSFQRTQLKSVPTNAFEFESNSTTRLLIELNTNANLTGDSFANDSLTKIGRPTTLLIDENVTFLNQGAFLPFLKENPMNSLIHDKPTNINCTDTRNTWLKNEGQRLHLCPVV